jgi:hypothetical protein
LKQLDFVDIGDRIEPTHVVPLTIELFPRPNSAERA